MMSLIPNSVMYQRDFSVKRLRLPVLYTPMQKFIIPWIKSGVFHITLSPHSLTKIYTNNKGPLFWQRAFIFMLGKLYLFQSVIAYNLNSVTTQAIYFPSNDLINFQIIFRMQAIKLLLVSEGLLGFSSGFSVSPVSPLLSGISVEVSLPQNLSTSS